MLDSGLWLFILLCIGPLFLMVICIDVCITPYIIAIMYLVMGMQTFTSIYKLFTGVICFFIFCILPPTELSTQHLQVARIFSWTIDFGADSTGPFAFQGAGE